MISKVKYIIREQTNPYDNLALEEVLTQTTEKDTVILYLWQNANTVVIGKNQNPWKECKVRELDENGGFLARRLSGGGAVFHDLGNLNFTFVAANENYDVVRQLEVILLAVKKLGINAEKTGRNDITVSGRKFSGNAFYNNGTNSYHHGTLLINANMSTLSKYLTVSKQKLSSKGVNSVQSRVANLSEFNTEITVCSMKEKLIEAFGEVYGITPQKLTEDEFDKAVLAESREKFASWEWLFGKRLEFTATMNEKFVWGEIEIQLQVDKGKVKKALIYTDAMEHSGFELIEDALKDCIFSTVGMAQAVCKLAKNNAELKQTILNDIQGLILRQNF